jgi:hypothetical protein
VHFEREFVVEHRAVFEEVIARTHRIAVGIFVATFVGYGIAIWVWFGGNTWAALIIATLSYLFFRQFRTLSFSLARMPLRGQAKSLPVLKQIDRALEKGRALEVMTELEAHLHAMGHEQSPRLTRVSPHTRSGSPQWRRAAAHLIAGPAGSTDRGRCVLSRPWPACPRLHPVLRSAATASAIQPRMKRVPPTGATAPRARGAPSARP